MLDLRQHLSSTNYTSAADAHADSGPAGKLAGSGALLVGASEAAGTAAEGRLVSVWSPVPDSAFSVMDICQRVQSFYLDTGRMPSGAEELIRHDFSRNKLRLEELRKADQAGRTRLLGKYFNPATGELYPRFDEDSPYALQLRVVPQADWDASYPDISDWRTASGEPSPVSHAMHVTVTGTEPGEKLIERTLYFGR